MAVNGESFLISQFHDFYREVVHLKRQVRRGAWVFESEEAEPTPIQAETGDRTAPSAVWQALLTLLERQALVARRSGGDFAVEIFRQAEYVMAGLADEVFLNLDWGGKESWQKHLLEAHLFQSHRAGEEFFDRLDELLQRRDPVYLDLARLYLFALSLGFQGKYRGDPDGAYELARYRRRLFNFICGRDPELESGTEPLFPTAHAGTLAQGKRKRLPYLRPWLVAFAALIALWILIAHPVWRNLIADMEPAIQSILGG